MLVGVIFRHLVGLPGHGGWTARAAILSPMRRRPSRPGVGRAAAAAKAVILGPMRKPHAGQGWLSAPNGREACMSVPWRGQADVFRSPLSSRCRARLRPFNADANRVSRQGQMGVRQAVRPGVAPGARRGARGAGLVARRRPGLAGMPVKGPSDQAPWRRYSWVGGATPSNSSSWVSMAWSLSTARSHRCSGKSPQCAALSAR
jgi:hypothetical protein